MLADPCRVLIERLRCIPPKALEIEAGGTQEYVIGVPSHRGLPTGSTCPHGWCRFICMLAAAGRPVDVLVPPIRRVLHERPGLLPGNRLLPDREVDRKGSLLPGS